jgi:hypothetical protein
MNPLSFLLRFLVLFPLDGADMVSLLKIGNNEIDGYHKQLGLGLRWSGKPTEVALVSVRSTANAKREAV